MIAALWWFAGAFCAWETHRFLLWVFFDAAMRLEETRDAGHLTPRGERWGKTAVYIGLVLDLTYNWSWAIVEFLDIPREALVTYRLKRYKYGTTTQPPATGWRLAKTEAYAVDLLDPNDPSGKHV